MFVILLPRRVARAGVSPTFRSCRTHLWRQRSSPFDEIGQRQHGEGAIGVLGQAAIANLGKASQALDDQERVFDLRADARLAAIGLPVGLGGAFR